MHVILDKIEKSDIFCFYALNRSINCPTQDALMKVITHMGSTIFAVVFSILLTLYNRYMGLILIANLLSSQAVIHLLKRIVNRPRPYKKMDWVIAKNLPKCQYSLPSGHSGSALSIALVLSSFFPALKVVAIAGALIVGVSRVYLGCHYPTDVVLGFAISYSIYQTIGYLT